MSNTLEDDIIDVINRHSAENDSNTPDFILSTYLLSCLAAFNVAVNRRENWYGRGGNSVINHRPAPTDAPTLKVVDPITE